MIERLVNTVTELEISEPRDSRARVWGWAGR